ncbi:hypothetical protein SAMN05444747_111158 [Variovorax sp. OV329]|nr:hypothetical protein SAMN05444747_111158 [Variovorax sp. OV329]
MTAAQPSGAALCRFDPSSVKALAFGMQGTPLDFHRDNRGPIGPPPSSKPPALPTISPTAPDVLSNGATSHMANEQTRPESHRGSNWSIEAFRLSHLTCGRMRRKLREVRALKFQCSARYETVALQRPAVTSAPHAARGKRLVTHRSTRVVQFPSNGRLQHDAICAADLQAAHGTLSMPPASGSRVRYPRVARSHGAVPSEFVEPPAPP